MIEDYFGDGSHWDVAISYVRQQVQDGTGKAPELAKDFVGDKPFLLTYGDILVKMETYRRMLKRWGEGDFTGLVTVTGSEDVTKGGLFFFDEKFHLNHLVEKPTTAQLDELRAAGRLKEGDTAWYNAGIHIFIPTLFDHTARLKKSPRGEYELTDALTRCSIRRSPSRDWRLPVVGWMCVTPKCCGGCKKAASFSACPIPRPLKFAAS